MILVMSCKSTVVASNKLRQTELASDWEMTIGKADSLGGFMSAAKEVVLSSAGPSAVEYTCLRLLNAMSSLLRKRVQFHHASCCF
jgi:hypothetical protein